MAHLVRLQQAKSGRHHDVSVQDHHRSDGPGPNAARSEGGSQSGLPDLEPHDVPGNAREFSSGLSAGRAAGDAGSQWSRASRPLYYRFALSFRNVEDLLLLAVLHVLEQNVDDGPFLCRPGGFAGRLAGQGWNRLVEPIRVVVLLELERKLLRFISIQRGSARHDPSFNPG